MESFFNDGTDSVHLLEWSGPVTSHGSPAFYDTICWQDFVKHFVRRSLPLHSPLHRTVTVLCQQSLRGNAFESLPISDATRSETDKGKGIQCNPCGADRVPGSIKIPVVREGVNLKNLSLNLNVNDLSLSIKSKQFFPQTTLAVNPQKRTDYAQQSVTRCLPNKIIHQLQSTQWTMKKRKK